MRFTDLLTGPNWSVAHQGRQLGRKTADLMSANLARQLIRAGVIPGRLTIFVVTSPIDMLITYFAISRLGLLASILSPRALRALPGPSEEGSVPVGRLVIPKRSTAVAVLPGVPVTRVDFRDTTCPDAAFTGQARHGAGAAHLVFASSGTTAAPKRIVHEERSLIANAAMVARYLRLTSIDRSLCLFPINFMYGLSTTLCGLLTGGCVEYCDFRNAALLTQQADLAGATVLPVIGDWAMRMADAWTGTQRPTRRLILNASDRLMTGQARALLPHATELWNNFGQTEAAPRLFAVQVTENNLARISHDDTIAPGYIANPKIKMRIGDMADPDGFGPLFYHSPYAMVGTLDPEGRLRPAPEWIDSGDLFRRTAEGLYQWGGRLAQSIKRNGHFISLRGVADRLLVHQAVTGVGFVKDTEGRLILYVESPALALPLHSELSSIVAHECAEMPTDLRILSALPRTESGKIDNRKLNIT